MLKIQATWTCERCSQTAVEEVGKIPDEWTSVGVMELTIDAESPTLIDFRLPKSDQRTLLCDECFGAYQYWLGMLKDKSGEDNLYDAVRSRSDEILDDNDQERVKSDKKAEGRKESDTVREGLRKQVERAPKIADTGQTLDDYPPVEFDKGKTPKAKKEEKDNG